MSEKPASMKTKAATIDRVLTSYYGRKNPPKRRPNPLDTLVETILSQNTNDANSGRAFTALKKAYPRWEKLMDEDARKVERIIRVGGLAGIKSKRIINALRFIQSERGELSLVFLRDMRPEEADAWLSRIKGVGPKTRAIVVLFSLGKPMFPVDTHIFRVTKRLGLLPERISRENAQARLAELVRESEYYNFHIVLIEHGRTICVARGPRCSVCPVSKLCRYYRVVYLAQVRAKGHT